jgi:hydrogenase-4 component E
MRPVHELLLMLVVLIDFWVLGTGRLSSTIRAAACQGAVLAMLPLALYRDASPHMLALAAGTLLVKAFWLPRLLTRAIREATDRREVSPVLGFATSLVLGAVAVAVAFAISPGLAIPGLRSDLLVPVALSTVMIGLIVLTTRRKAVTQVVGYLVLENGIYVFGLSQAQRVPFLVDVGVLLDVFAGVFVMGIVVFHMNRAFDSLDTSNLAELGD